MAAEETVSKKLTRFEKARVLGARAIQLSQGAKPMKHKEIDNTFSRHSRFVLSRFCRQRPQSGDPPDGGGFWYGCGGRRLDHHGLHAWRGGYGRAVREDR